MLNCYKFRLYPNAKQERILFRWIGCQRLIYNAKVQEDRYFRRFAQRMVGTAGKPVPVDQQYSQFITERRPLLRDVPSQILRNGAVKFHRAYQRFLKKLGGRPKFKKKSGRQAVWLSRESFEFIPQIDDQTGNIVSYQLSLDTKRFPVGITAYLAHRSHSVPSSIHIAVQGGRWWLSLAAEDTALTTPGKNLEAAVEQIAEDLRHLSADQLAKPTQGGDRGVAKLLSTSDGKVFDIGPVLKTRIKKSRQRHKKWQQRASRRKQGSKEPEAGLSKSGAVSAIRKNGRNEYAHQTSHQLVANDAVALHVFENLRIDNMTKRPKAKKEMPKAGCFPIERKPKPGLIAQSYRRLGDRLSCLPPIKHYA